MDSNQELIVNFFEEIWPEVEKSAKAIWGTAEPTGRYNGTITCPKDGQLIKREYVTKEEWEEATLLIRYCKVCGKRVKVELSKEIMYEYQWRAKLVEMILEEKAKTERLNELKGIKVEEKTDAKPTEVKVL
jgi:hypothetical protein